jgi:hypothetical protein
MTDVHILDSAHADPNSKRSEATELRRLRRLIREQLAGAVIEDGLDIDLANGMLTVCGLPELPRRWTVRIGLTFVCEVTAGTDHDAFDTAEDAIAAAVNDAACPIEHRRRRPRTDPRHRWRHRPPRPQRGVRRIHTRAGLNPPGSAAPATPAPPVKATAPSLPRAHSPIEGVASAMSVRSLVGVAVALIAVVVLCAGGIGALFTGGGGGLVCAVPSGSAGPTATTSAPPPGGAWPRIGRWDSEQAGHAATIIAAGTRLGAPPRGWVIALATAMQESDLRNPSGGPDDSIGLFQQRPSQGWGTRPCSRTRPTPPPSSSRRC